MATDVTEPAATVEPEQKPARSPALRPFRSRFAVVYLALAVGLGAGIAGLVTVLSENSGSAGSGIAKSSAPTGPWSSWRPTAADEPSQLDQIVKHVSPTYRLPNGDQLVSVLPTMPAAVPTNKGSVAIRAIAVKGTAGPDLLTSSNNVLFDLCGLGASCSITTGTPSITRSFLLRREALELALYTFKYVPGVDYVLGLIPPRPGTQPEFSVFFRRSDLAAQLEQPLSATLSAKTPGVNSLSTRDVTTIDQLAPAYPYGFTTDQLGEPVLVLQPSA